MTKNDPVILERFDKIACIIIFKDCCRFEIGGQALGTALILTIKQNLNPALIVIAGKNVPQCFLFAFLTPQMLYPVLNEPLQRIGNCALASSILPEDGEAFVFLAKIKGKGKRVPRKALTLS